MFADDIVVVASSMDQMQSLFGHVHDFCESQDLTINADKTVLLVSGPAISSYAAGERITFGNLQFKVVRSFKYLGLHFDPNASSKHMIAQLLVKGCQTFYWLLRFVTT